jgi:hypothetical protein
VSKYIPYKFLVKENNTQELRKFRKAARATKALQELEQGLQDHLLKKAAEGMQIFDKDGKAWSQEEIDSFNEEQRGAQAAQIELEIEAKECDVDPETGE